MALHKNKMLLTKVGQTPLQVGSRLQVSIKEVELREESNRILLKTVINRIILCRQSKVLTDLFLEKHISRKQQFKGA